MKESKSTGIKKIDLFLLCAPLQQPFRIATGQHDDLENILLRLELGDGTVGLGEAAIATHITGETKEETLKNLRAQIPFLLGRDAREYLRISGELHERLGKNKAAVAALETALLDALTKREKIPLWRFFGPQSRLLVSDITIVIGSLEQTQEAVCKYHTQGFRQFKVKIGKDPDEDFARLKIVQRFAPGSRIYLDANQGYSVKGILNFLKRLQKAGIHPELLEQPVAKADWDGLKEVTRLSPVPVCADESVATLPQTFQAIREKAVDAINIKLMKSGLIWAREIACLCRAAGIKLMIGAMMETSLATTTAAHLAAGLGYFQYIDLDTPFFLRAGFDKNPFLSRRGVYDLKKVKAGIGIVPAARSVTTLRGDRGLSQTL